MKQRLNFNYDKRYFSTLTIKTLTVEYNKNIITG